LTEQTKVGAVRALSFVLLSVASTAASGDKDTEYVEGLKELGLQPPVTVSESEIFADGGTLYVTLAGTESTKAELCIDRRLRTKTSGRLFTGARHPTLPGAQLVERGSKTEKAALLILKRWLDQNFTSDLQKKLRDRNTVAGLSKDELKAARVVDVAAALEAIK
jgi:hypothetical protein